MFNVTLIQVAQTHSITFDVARDKCRCNLSSEDCSSLTLEWKFAVRNVSAGLPNGLNQRNTHR